MKQLQSNKEVSFPISPAPFLWSYYSFPYRLFLYVKRAQAALAPLQPAPFAFRPGAPVTDLAQLKKQVLNPTPILLVCDHWMDINFRSEASFPLKNTNKAYSKGL
jgi:hypothetical protein